MQKLKLRGRQREPIFYKSKKEGEMYKKKQPKKTGKQSQPKVICCKKIKDAIFDKDTDPKGDGRNSVLIS